MMISLQNQRGGRLAERKNGRGVGQGKDKPVAHTNTHNAEFWRAVGAVLRKERFRKGLESTNNVLPYGGPDYHTVNNIEAGKSVQTKSISQYVDTLGLRIADVMREAASQPHEATSAAGSQLARIFDDLPPEDQQLLEMWALRMDEVRRAAEGGAAKRPASSAILPSRARKNPRAI